MGVALVATAVTTLLFCGLGASDRSSAAFTTSSGSTLRATAARTSAWLQAYCQSTDPDGLGGYALRRVQTPPGPPAATGMDEMLAVDLGGFPDGNKNFTFDRTFTIETPAAFPETGVTQVTITVRLAADQVTGDQPLRSARLSAVGVPGGSSSVTLGPGEKRQLNVQVRARARFALGRTYYPHVILTVAWPGGPTGHFVYDYPVAVTDAGF